MGTIIYPQHRKLIVGFIYKDEKDLKRVELILSRRYGPVDHRSPELSFTYTKYYEDEMGSNLKRRFVSFGRLLLTDRCWRVKLFTNRIESRFSAKGKRVINIDPGYITLGKLVLFTTKDYTHRLYLGDGIFGESTLQFKDGSFRAWEHTYPDYRTEEYIIYFNTVRDIYQKQLK